MEEEGGCLSHWVDTGSVESHCYFLARRTVLEMLRDRGCAVTIADLELTLADFRSTYGDKPDPDSLQISSFLLDDPSKKVLVIFCGTDPIKKSTVRGILERVSKEENLTRLILVLQSKVTPKAREDMKEMIKFKVETFQITELLINITKHVLKPRHDILTEEEKQELLKKYSVTDRQLPRMLETDAVARYYGLGHGQVVKITYDGELTGFHVTYRCIM